MSSSTSVPSQHQRLPQDTNSPLDNAQHGNTQDDATEHNTWPASSVSAKSIFAKSVVVDSIVVESIVTKSISARSISTGPASANGNDESSGEPTTQSNPAQGSISPGGVSVDAETPSERVRELFMRLQQTSTAESSTSQARLAGSNANGQNGSSQGHNARDNTNQGNATEGNTTPDSVDPASVTAKVDAVLAQFKAMAQDMRQTLAAYRSTSRDEATQALAGVRQVDASTQTTEGILQTRPFTPGSTYTGVDAATQTEAAAARDVKDSASTSSTAESLSVEEARALEIARRIVIPVLKQNADSRAEFVFPCLGNGNGQPGGWTALEEEEVAAWLARRLLPREGSQHAGLESEVHGTPVAHLAVTWEYADEWEFAREMVGMVGTLLHEGLTTHDIKAPSTMDIRNWLRLVRAMNILRKFVYMQLGDDLVCRIHHLFVRPDFQRQGHGARLIKELCHAMDEETAYGVVFAHPAEVHLYSGFGFKRFIPEFPGDFGHLSGMIRNPVRRPKNRPAGPRRHLSQVRAAIRKWWAIHSNVEDQAREFALALIHEFMAGRGTITCYRGRVRVAGKYEFRLPPEGHEAEPVEGWEDQTTETDGERLKGKTKATEAGVDQAGPADEAERSAANAGNPGKKRKRNRKRKRKGKKAKAEAADDGAEQAAPEDKAEGSGGSKNGEDQAQESDGDEAGPDQGAATVVGVEQPGPADEPGEGSNGRKPGKKKRRRKYKPRHKRP